jgi:hypothetical protein
MLYLLLIAIFGLLALSMGLLPLGKARTKDRTQRTIRENARRHEWDG